MGMCNPEGWKEQQEQMAKAASDDDFIEGEYFIIGEHKKLCNNEIKNEFDEKLDPSKIVGGCDVDAET